MHTIIWWNYLISLSFWQEKKGSIFMNQEWKVIIKTFKIKGVKGLKGNKYPATVQTFQYTLQSRNNVKTICITNQINYIVKINVSFSTSHQQNTKSVFTLNDNVHLFVHR